MDSLSERETMRKITLRLVPFLFLLYVVAYLDRVNVGFAKLGMGRLPWFSETVFGAGAGIFFVGYFLFEIPSNLLLQKVGARKWIARIMFTWGVIAMAMALSSSARSFYGIRFLLGLAEAGFFPGVILYLTRWYRPYERARIIAMLMTANAAAWIVGGPVSGLLLDSGHVWRLAPWQWMFVAEGIPALVLGFVVLMCLPDGPRSARWLTEEEMEFVESRIATDSAGGPRQRHTVSEAFCCPEVWIYSLLYFALVFGMYGISFWLPSIIKAFGVNNSNFKISLLSDIPYIVAAIVMVLNGRHSDKSHERRAHIGVPAFVGAVGLYSLSLHHAPAIQLVEMSVAAGGMWATLGPFWSMASARLTGTGAAAGIALINSIGNLGGFVGPLLVGYFGNSANGKGHDTAIGLQILSVSILVGAVVAFLSPRPAPHVAVTEAGSVPAAAAAEDVPLR